MDDDFGDGEMTGLFQPSPADRSSPFPMQPRRRWIVALGMLAGTMLALFLMGRNPVCPCGVVSLWQQSSDPAENSQQFADWYSALHIVFGIGLAAFTAWVKPSWSSGAVLLSVLLGHCAWEIAENTPLIIGIFSGGVNAPHYEGDSILNSLGDSVFAIGGAVAYLNIPGWASVLIVAAVEVAVAFAIHDGFVLGSLRLLGVDV